jgi:hypothetical protein
MVWARGGGLGLADAHNMSVLVEVYGAVCLDKYRPVLGISEPKPHSCPII